jgi:purine-binding chemotaxis protein CheW
MNYLSFRLAGVEYAVDVSVVETVVDHGSTVAVPSPVPYMKGVMDLRGRLIPVIDLRKKFGLAETTESGKEPVVVFSVADAGNGNLVVGALVDEVSEVVGIADEAIEASRPEGARLWERYVRGVARLEGAEGAEARMIVIIDVEGLFSIHEIEELGAQGR